MPRLETKTLMEKKVMSIDIYQAVIESGIRDLEGFWRWKEQHSNDDIVAWMPS